MYGLWVLVCFNSCSLLLGYCRYEILFNCCAELITLKEGLGNILFSSLEMHESWNHSMIKYVLFLGLIVESRVFIELAGLVVAFFSCSLGACMHACPGCLFD